VKADVNLKVRSILMYHSIQCSGLHKALYSLDAC